MIRCDTHVVNEPGDLIAPLLPGERVTWWGRPDPGVLFTASDLFLVPFSVLWCGFAIFGEVSLIAALVHPPPGGPPPDVSVLFGTIFTVVGLYFVFGRFVVKVAGKRSTIYALTDSRILVIGRRSVRESRLEPPVYTRTARGHLTVRFSTPMRSLTSQMFGGSNVVTALYLNTGMDFFIRNTAPLAFFDVADVDGLGSAVRSLNAPV